MTAPGRPPLGVTLLDRSRTFAEAVAVQLRAEPDVVLTEVRTPDDAAQRVRARHTQVAVVDAALAAEVLTRAAGGRRWTGPPHVVVLADRREDGWVTPLVGAGASGWVRRSAPYSCLIGAIRGVWTGMTVIPADLLTHLVAELVAPLAPPPSIGRDALVARLTVREREILAMLERGLSRSEIAERLALSPNTVRTHLQRVLPRLQVHSTLAAVAAVREAKQRQRRMPVCPSE